MITNTFRVETGKNGENVLFDSNHEKPIWLDEFEDKETFLNFMRSMMYISYEDEVILEKIWRSYHNA